MAEQPGLPMGSESHPEPPFHTTNANDHDEGGDPDDTDATPAPGAMPDRGHGNTNEGHATPPGPQTPPLPAPDAGPHQHAQSTAYPDSAAAAPPCTAPPTPPAKAPHAGHTPRQRSRLHRRRPSPPDPRRCHARPRRAKRPPPRHDSPHSDPARRATDQATCPESRYLAAPYSSQRQRTPSRRRPPHPCQPPVRAARLRHSPSP